MRRSGGRTDDEHALARLEVLYVDDGTFERFYASEYRQLLRIAWAAEGRRDLAEEAVQDAMLTVHERWRQVSAYDKPGAYARRVLLNGLVSRGRRRTREQNAIRRLGSAPDVHVDEEPPDSEFWAAVRALPERQAQALTLRYVEDRSVEDIAEILEVAEGTVKVHLHRGRLALFDRLGAGYREEGL
jgi:RNA polymerase sigma-70 factor, ECF subfamily